VPVQVTLANLVGSAKPNVTENVLLAVAVHIQELHVIMVTARAGENESQLVQHLNFQVSRLADSAPLSTSPSTISATAKSLR